MKKANLTFDEQINKESVIVSAELEDRLPSDLSTSEDFFVTVDNFDYSVNIVSATRILEDSENKIQIELSIDNFSFLKFIDNKKASFLAREKRLECDLFSYYPSGANLESGLLTIFIGDT